MLLSFLFVVIGLALILAEFYLPGAIMGILGSIAILIGVILFASNSSSLLAIILFFAGTGISIWLVIRYALWRIVHAKANRSIYSNHNQEGFQASAFDAAAIGKTGTVVTDLKPGGYISIEGKQHPALSLTGYIPKGEKVEVVSGQEQSLIVKLKQS